MRPGVFTVVIPTFARPEALARCLGALGALEFPPERLEVVVVDDGTPGGVDEVVESAPEHLDARLFRQERSGPAAARNRGAAEARGEFLAFTDDDCRPDPGWLAACARVLSESPNRMVGGHTLNGLPENACSSASQIIVDMAYSHYNGSVNDARFVASNNIALPRHLYLALDGFDPRFRVASEDRDFCDRWRAAGHKIRYEPTAQVLHYHRQTVRSFLRLHFRYGRGAYQFHRARAARGRSDFGQQLRFHGRFLNLVWEPLAKMRFGARLRVMVLLAVWQVANLVGFLYETVRSRLPGASTRGSGEVRTPAGRL